IVYLHSLIDLHPDDAHLSLLIYAKALYSAYLNPINFEGAADPQPGDRGEPCSERIGILSEQGNLTELHGHVTHAKETDQNKNADNGFHGILLHHALPPVWHRYVATICWCARAFSITSSIASVEETSVIAARMYISKLA